MSDWLTFRVGILNEDVKAVDEVGAVEGISANANTQGLTQSRGGRLRNSLVRECARTRHNANVAAFVDEARHNANLALFRSNDS